MRAVRFDLGGDCAGLGQFFLKAALGLGAGLFGWALGAVGCVPNQPQAPETLAGLKDIMVVLPMVGVAGAGLAMWFYPLRRGDHEAIVRDLRARPAGAGRPVPAPPTPAGDEIYEHRGGTLDHWITPIG